MTGVINVLMVSGLRKKVNVNLWNQLYQHRSCKGGKGNFWASNSLSLFLKIRKDFEAFISSEIRFHSLTHTFLIDSLPKCAVWVFAFWRWKGICSSNVIGRIFATLKDIIHNNRRDTIFNFISFSSKILYISFVNCKWVITL